METDIVMLNIEWFLLLFYRMGEREWEREGRKKVYKNENGIIINSNSLFHNGKGDKDMGIEARDVLNKKTKQ